MQEQPSDKQPARQLTDEGVMNHNLGLKQPASLQRRSSAERRLWHDARLFQERAQRLLGEQNVSFVEWLLLETLQELIDETGDAVSQIAVARRSALSERVVSHWMRVMDDFGFIDREPGDDGRAWRVELSKLGQRMLQTSNERLEAAGITR